MAGKKKTCPALRKTSSKRCGRRVQCRSERDRGRRRNASRDEVRKRSMPINSDAHRPRAKVHDSTVNDP